VTEIIITPRARGDIEEAIAQLELPSDTWARVRHSLRVIETFPLAGKQLSGVWRDCRALIGPWGWLIVVYMYIESEDEVRVITVQDGRSAGAAPAKR